MLCRGEYMCFVEGCVCCVEGCVEGCVIVILNPRPSGSILIISFLAESVAKIGLSLMISRYGFLNTFSSASVS